MFSKEDEYIETQLNGEAEERLLIDGGAVSASTPELQFVEQMALPKFWST